MDEVQTRIWMKICKNYVGSIWSIVIETTNLEWSKVEDAN